MNPATVEWIVKAEGDFATAGRELRARLVTMERYAVDGRYPSDVAEKADAKVSCLQVSQNHTVSPQKEH